MNKESTSEVKLVPLTGCYIDNTYRWLQDDRLCALIDCLKSPTIQENNEYWAKQNATNERKNFAILNAREEHIGNCGLCHIDKLRRKAEIWIYIVEQQGYGYGRGAVHSLLKYGMCDLELERLYLRVLSTNEKAQRFFKSIGFVFEGRWRHDTLVSEQFADSLWFSMLANEFVGIKTGMSECQ